jgi:hypothetical protein
MNNITRGMRKRVGFLGLCLILCAGLFTINSFCIEPNAVIAVVEGEKVIYRQITQEPKEVLSWYQNTFGKEPTKDEIDKTIIQKERAALANQIHRIIEQKKMKELGIKTSDKEVEIRMKSYYTEHNLNPEEITKDINLRISKIAKALREALKNPSEEKKIYERELSSFMEYEEWTSRRQYCNTVEAIEAFDEPFARVEELYKPNPALKAWLLDEKFRDAITKDVSVTDEEVKVYYTELYDGQEDKPLFAEAEKNLKEELLTRKKQQKEKQWWQEQYKNVKIEIKDERFKDVMNMLVSPEDGSDINPKHGLGE